MRRESTVFARPCRPLRPPGHVVRSGELSARVMAILADETPFVDRVSIDEAFFDISPGRFSDEHPIQIAQRISRRVSELGVTCSIGLGRNKTVAKIASERDKPHGLTIVTPGTEHGFLAPLPVRAMSGIGAAAESALARVGIRTLGQLAEASDGLLSPIFGINAELVRRRAAGLEVSEVRAIDAPDDVFLAPLPVRAMSGIGAAAESALARVGIRTLGQLAEASDGLLSPIFGINAELVRRRAAGLEVSEVRAIDAPDDVKSVSNERTFAHDLTDPSDVKAAIQLLSESVGARLRRRDLAGRTVTLKLKYSFGEGCHERHRRRRRKRACARGDTDARAACRSVRRPPLPHLRHQRRTRAPKGRGARGQRSSGHRCARRRQIHQQRADFRARPHRPQRRQSGDTAALRIGGCQAPPAWIGGTNRHAQA